MEQKEQPGENTPEIRQAPSSLLSNVLSLLGLEIPQQEHTLEELRELLLHPDWSVRVRAVSSLSAAALSQDDERVELLLTTVQDKDAMVRATAVRVLSASPDALPLEYLLAALRDPDWHVRETAIRALQSRDEQVPAGMLLEGLHETDRYVQQAVHEHEAEVRQASNLTQPHRVDTHTNIVKNVWYVLYDQYAKMQEGTKRLMTSLTGKGTILLSVESFASGQVDTTQGPPTQRRHSKRMHIIEGLVAAVLIVGLLASWLFLSQRIYTSTAGKILYTQQIGQDFLPSWSANTNSILFVDSTATSLGVQVWDLTTNKVSPVHTYPDGFHYSTSTDYICQEKDRTLHVINLITNREVLTYHHPDVDAVGQGFSGDGSSLATIDSSGTVILWNLNTGKQVRSFYGLRSSKPESTELYWSGDGHHLAVSNFDDANHVHLFDTATGRAVFTTSVGPAGIGGQIEWSASGKRFYISTNLTPDNEYPLPKNRVISVWDATSGKEISTHQGWSFALWGGDDRLFATDQINRPLANGGTYLDTRAIEVWDANTGRTLLRLNASPALTLVQPMLSADGTHFFASTGPSTMSVWDTTSGQKINSYSISKVKFEAIGMFGMFLNRCLVCDYYAATGTDGVLRVWDIKTGSPVYTYTVPSGPLYPARWSFDGKKFMAIGARGTVAVLQAPT